jgi:hypothetical protein
MPAQEIAYRRQKVLLWAALASFDRDGQHRVATTFVEISARWTDERKEMLDPMGNVIMVDASAVVNLDVPIGSIMWKGSQTDLDAAISGTGTHAVPTGDIMEAVAWEKTPDIKNRSKYREVGLKRRLDAMPMQG